ncbi:MAG: ATP-binding protein [Bacteroidota bacterium]
MIKGSGFYNQEESWNDTSLKELKEINKELQKQINILKTKESHYREQINQLSFNKKSIETRLDYHTHKLMKQRKKCQMLTSDLEDFYYAASHHLKTPIRNISSFAQLLQKGYEEKSNTKEVEFMDFVASNAQHLNALLEDLLFYITLSDQAESSTTTILPEEVLAVVKMELESLLKETGSQVIINDLPLVKANPFLMQLLFKELIENAIKFRRDQPLTITIEASYRDNHHVFSIKDNGMGLSENYADKVFMLFGKLDNSGKFPGTGLGLALCRKIMELHRGQIWYHSKRKDGTTFYFTLPDHLLIAC